MFARILTPYDGSQQSDTALRKAVELARHCGAELLILTVFRHHSMLEASLSMVRAQEPGNIDDAMRDHATEIAEYGRKLAQDAGHADVRAFVQSGHPARTIVEFAKRHEVDLVVLGSRGLGSADGYLLGSVSHKVTGLAGCPVMVV